MAILAKRFSKNAPGRYYIDAECIDCNLCRTIAPDIFKWEQDEYSYVGRQPKDKKEEQRCREALEECPVSAIGDDGDAS